MQTPITFRPHKVMRIMLIALWILLATFLLGIVYFMFTEVTTQSEQNTANYILYSIILTALLFGAFVWVYNSKKLIADDKRITYKSILKERRISLNDIKGYRKYNEIPIFYTKRNTGHKKIRTFANPKLTKWVESNFNDLDFEDYIDEEDEILADTRLGSNTLEREASLDKARSFANVVTIGCGLFMFVAIFFRLSPLIFFYVGLLGLTLICYGLMAFRGLVRLERKTARASVWIPSVLVILFLTFGWMGIGTYAEFSLLKYAFIVSLIVAMLYIFILVGKSNYSFKYVWIPIILFFGLTLTGSMAINVVLDFSTPRTYTTNVKDVIKKEGRYTSYEMKLNSWRPDVKNPAVKVTRDTYINTPNGATVKIIEHTGALGKAWYTVHKDGIQLNNSDTSVNLGGDIKRLFE